MLLLNQVGLDYFEHNCFCNNFSCSSNYFTSFGETFMLILVYAILIIIRYFTLVVLFQYSGFF